MQSFSAFGGFHPVALPFLHSSPTSCGNILCLASLNQTLQETQAAAKITPTASTPRNTAAKRDDLPFSPRRAAVSELKNSTSLDAAALDRFEGTLQVQDLNIILRHFGDMKRWKDVSQLFDWMQKHGKTNVASYSSFIKSMGQSQNPVKGLQIYNSVQDESLRYDVAVCNSVLGCLVRNGKFDSSIELFEKMKRDGLTPDAVTYSTLLSGCTKAKDGYSKAMQLVKELESNGLHMDAVIYGTLMAICASSNLCQEAEAFFQKMKNEGHSPNIFHYSSLLNAYSLNGNFSKADELLEDLKAGGFVPNKVILTTLLKVYVKGGLFEKARGLLRELEAMGYAKDEIPYCILMDGLAKAGHIAEAKEIFEYVENSHVQTDGYSHSIIISAFCRSGLLEEAKQLAQNYEASCGKYDLVMFNTLLRAYCRAGEMKCVMQLLKKMDELSISPDGSTFRILIKYFCKEKLYLLAHRMVLDMHSRGHKLDEELCSSLILRLGETSATSESFSVYNMLRYSKRTICKALHEKMLNILVAGRLLKDAYVVMKDNVKVIPKPSLKKFALTFMKSGNINLINDVIKALHTSGQRIDEVCSCWLESNKPENTHGRNMNKHADHVKASLNILADRKDEVVFRAAVSRYVGQPEKKDLLLQLLHWMTGHGYVVDSLSRNLLLRNSHIFGQRHIAEIISKQHANSKEKKWNN